MSIDFEDTDKNIVKKPQVFLKSVTFNDNVQLMLKRNSIIVFTGPNNSGKSQVLKDIGISYTEEIGEAAFYGPKLDVNVKPAVGNEYTLSTCQLDFCLPAKFDLKYIDKDGTAKTPVVLHRAILGSLDRFMAYLLEETKGVLPLWLSPIQVNIIPVNNEYHLDYANKVNNLLIDNNIRTNLDDRDEKVGYKLREGVMKKILYTLVLGDNEKANNTITYRKYGTEDKVTISLDEFVKMIKDEIQSKK